MFYKRNNQIITSKRNPKHPLKQCPDQWDWVANKEGMFSVASVKKLLDEDVIGTNSEPFEWNNWAPLKVFAFG